MDELEELISETRELRNQFLEVMEQSILEISQADFFTNKGYDLFQKNLISLLSRTMAIEKKRREMIGLYHEGKIIQRNDPSIFQHDFLWSNLGDRMLVTIDGLAKIILEGSPNLDKSLRKEFEKDIKLVNILRKLIKDSGEICQTYFELYLFMSKIDPSDADAMSDYLEFYHPDYKLLKVLGSGANKNVFLAESKHLKDSRFALKLWNLKEVREYLKERSGIDLTYDELLGHEIRAAEISMQEDQQYINRVRSISHFIDDKYIIIENLFDMTLEDAIESKGKIVGTWNIMTLGQQIFEGLLTFKKYGLCHGDLKAANVGLKIGEIDSKYYNDITFFKNGEVSDPLLLKVALTDAGYATTFKLDDRSGTWYFGGASVRAPELYSFNGELVKPTFESDLWSLGVLMYYMTTGEYPFYRVKSNERGDIKEYEKRVYDDIYFKLDDPDKRLFDRAEFQDLCYKDSKGNKIIRGSHMGLEELRESVSSFLKINPNHRNEERETKEFML